jgi:predicted DsbA family dithiol-disulfide isomerase
MRPVRLIVYSDYLCPWCNVGSVRLHQVQAELGGALELEWRSFLLRPRADPERTLEKFRTYTQSWLRPAAEEPAAEFRVWSTDEGPPSHSIPPHLVAKAAATFGAEAFERMHHRMLRAYFAENRDITSPETLRALWLDVGLPGPELTRAAEPEVLRKVVVEHNEAVDMGISGVPAVRAADSDAAITGAHPVEMYRRWIEKIRALD